MDDCIWNRFRYKFNDIHTLFYNKDGINKMQQTLQVKCSVKNCTKECEMGDNYFCHNHRKDWRIKCIEIFGFDKMGRENEEQIMLKLFQGG